MKPTKSMADTLFKYDHVTGRLIRKSGGKGIHPDAVGHPAGWSKNGYFYVSIDGIEWPSCKIVWLINYGEIPERYPDHVDLDGSNDRLNNLRLATKSQNSANSRMRMDNKSGPKGVSYCQSTRRWRADITANKKRINLGRFYSKKTAHAAYMDAAKKYFGEFARAK